MTIVNVDLVIHPGERVGLAGFNGSGKSTLVGSATGRLKPNKGNVTHHTRARIQCFSQHSVEELEEKGKADEEHGDKRFDECQCRRAVRTGSAGAP